MTTHESAYLIDEYCPFCGDAGDESVAWFEIPNRRGLSLLRYYHCSMGHRWGPQTAYVDPGWLSGERRPDTVSWRPTADACHQANLAALRALESECGEPVAGHGLG